jgi:hypothetical protein
MGSMRIRPLTLVLLAGVATNLAAKQKPSSEVSHHEQIHFSIEEDLKRVVALPETVLDILMTDEFVVRARACEKRMAIPNEARSSLFAASEVHLSKSQQPDFVILGRGCLMGTNIGSFWMVEKSPHGFRVVLAWASHDLDILPRKTHGRHNLRSVSVTANTISTTICKFDGQKYVAIKRDLEPLP